MARPHNLTSTHPHITAFSGYSCYTSQIIRAHDTVLTVDDVEGTEVVVPSPMRVFLNAYAVYLGISEGPYPASPGIFRRAYPNYPPNPGIFEAGKPVIP